MIRPASLALLAVVLLGCTASPEVTIENRSSRAVGGYLHIPVTGGFLYPPPSVRLHFAVGPGEVGTFIRRDGHRVWNYADDVIVALPLAENRWYLWRALDVGGRRRVGVVVIEGPAETGQPRLVAADESIKYETTVETGELEALLGSLMED